MWGCLIYVGQAKVAFPPNGITAVHPPTPGLDNDGNRAALGWEFQESREGTARYLHIVGVGQLLPVSVSLLLHHILPHPFIFIL